MNMLPAEGAEADIGFVTRSETSAIAERYLRHVWIPTLRNVFHGIDAHGVHVDTPDIEFRPSDSRPGWWVVGASNGGLPYKWGGFDSIEEFDAGIKAGKYAGDGWTAHRRGLPMGGPISNDTVGVDCSGFVSRCWKLPRQYSTKELPSLCRAIDPDDLREGDILNKAGEHVLLFKCFDETDKQQLWAYEAGSPHQEGSPPTLRVLFTKVSLQKLLDLGYTPYRFGKITESTEQGAAANP